jgi:hypothetical protein
MCIGVSGQHYDCEWGTESSIDNIVRKGAELEVFVLIEVPTIQDDVYITSTPSPGHVSQEKIHL